jgi:tetratricopeptide (TPR) repeat protein
MSPYQLTNEDELRRNIAEHLDSKITLIEAFRSQGKYAEAETEVENAIRYASRQEEKVEKWIVYRLALEQGLIQRLLDHSPDAINTYSKLLAYVDADNELRKDPTLVSRVWWELATAHFECSDYQAARLAYEKALGNYSLEDPNHYSILLSLGDCSMGTRAHAKANDYYQKVLASSHTLDIDKLKARAGMAKVLYELRDFRQAASTFEALLTNYPSDDPGYFNTLLWLGGCFEALWMESRARDCYEDILAAQSALEEDKLSAQERLKRLTSFSGGSQILH